jgi:hypothetical protein
MSITEIWKLKKIGGANWDLRKKVVRATPFDKKRGSQN